MGKQGSSAQTMRNREDKGGLKQNSQVQARSGQASRHLPTQRQTPALRAQQRLQAHHERQDSETALWEYRCAELGFAQWTKRIGPATGWNMARTLAEAIDHDEARIMAFGGKKYVLELRLHGSKAVTRYEIGGFPIYKYVAHRVN